MFKGTKLGLFIYCMRIWLLSIGQKNYYSTYSSILHKVKNLIFTLHSIFLNFTSNYYNGNKIDGQVRQESQSPGGSPEGVYMYVFVWSQSVQLLINHYMML